MTLLRSFQVGRLRCHTLEGGLQLLLNPDLFVFEGGSAFVAPVAARVTMTPPAAVSGALASLGGGLSSLLDIGHFLSQKYSQNTVRRT